MMAIMPSCPLIMLIIIVAINVAIGVDDKWKAALSGVVISHNILPQYDGDTIEQCMERCEPMPSCLSVDFRHDEACLLNDADWDTDPASETRSPTHMYLARSASVETGMCTRERERLTPC